MADEADPPRKFYGFKPAEFERVNEPKPNPTPDGPTADPGIVPVASQKIDINELIRAAAGPGSALGANSAANRSNEVHEVLRDNFERDKAAGLFHVTPGDDKQRRQRIRNYWIFLVLMDTPLAFAAWGVRPSGQMGPASAIVFVCAIAGIGMFTAWWTWHNFFLRTER